MKTRDPRFLRSTVAVHRSGARRSGRAVAAIAIMILFAGIGAAILGYLYFTAPSQFVVRTLVINGAVFADEAAIRAAVLEKTGGNMLLVDLLEVCRAVDAVPWVEKTAARKVLPDTLQLDIVERRPSAYVVIGEEIWLADAGGTIIDRLKPEHPFIGLPLIRGLDALTEAERPARLSRGVALLAELEQDHPDWYTRISDIDCADPAALRITIAGARAPVIVGDENPIAGLAKYFMIEGTLQGRYDTVEHFDARFTRRLYVKTPGKNQ